MATACAPAFADRAPDAAPAYVGTWAADPAYCANLPQSDNGPEIIDPDAVYGWEYSCDISRVDPVDFGQSWQVRLDCLDAGFTETWDEMWFITVDDQMLRIGPDGHWSLGHRCPVPNADKSE